MANTKKSGSKKEVVEEDISLNLEFYPWQTFQQNSLLDQLKNARLHHAFLFYGKPGIGKFDFACAFAARLLCKDQASSSEQNKIREGRTEACKECRACKMFESCTHPDFYLLRPEKEEKQIQVDEVRELVRFMSKSSSLSGKRIVIIEACEQMNLAASNALLKFLEEPGEEVHLFLVSSQIDSLLPTIRSRCQKLSFPPVLFSEAKGWLEESMDLSGEALEALWEFSEGSPLRALDSESDPIYLEQNEVVRALAQLLNPDEGIFSVSQQIEDYDLLPLLAWWYAICADVLKASMGAGEEYMRFKSLAGNTKSLSGNVDSAALELFMKDLLIQRRQLLTGSTVNGKLLLDSLLLSWKALALKS
jgi:DNA polymerase-3 subunit delta'